MFDTHNGYIKNTHTTKAHAQLRRAASNGCRRGTVGKARLRAPLQRGVALVRAGGTGVDAVFDAPSSVGDGAVPTRSSDGRGDSSAARRVVHAAKAEGAVSTGRII